MHFSLSPIIVGASLATFIVAHPEHFYARDVEGPLFARDAYERKDLYARNYRFSDALARRDAEHDLVARGFSAPVNKREIYWHCPNCKSWMSHKPVGANANCAHCGAAYQRVDTNDSK